MLFTAALSSSKPRLPRDWAALALELIRNYTPDASSFSECLGLPPGELANSVFERTVAKLEREPVEDFRIDFEDGYGYRSDAEEDGHAVSTAQLLARGAGKPRLSAFHRDSHQTVYRSASRAVGANTGSVSDCAVPGVRAAFRTISSSHFPRSPCPKQVSELVELLDQAEARHGLEPGDQDRADDRNAAKHHRFFRVYRHSEADRSRARALPRLAFRPL